MQHSIHILCRLCITHMTLCTQTQHSTAQRSTDIGWQKTHWKTEKHMFVYCWTIASFLRQWHGWRRIRALRWSVNGKANHVRMKHMQFQGIVNLTHSHFLRNCVLNQMQNLCSIFDQTHRKIRKLLANWSLLHHIKCVQMQLWLTAKAAVWTWPL